MIRFITLALIVGLQAQLVRAESSCSYLEQFENCSFKTEKKLTFARECRRIEDKLFLVRLCDGYECTVKSVSSERKACGNGGPHPGLAVRYNYLLNHKVFEDMLQVANKVCPAKHKLSIAEIKKQIRSDKTFQAMYETLSFKSNAEHFSQDGLEKSDKYFLILPPDPDAYNLISLVAGNEKILCIGHIWEELGVTHIWVTRQEKTHGITLVFDIKKKKWLRLSELYPSCK